MQLEHRKENSRLEISRPVEIVGPDSEANIQGYMKNLSNGGMRARFDDVPRLGDLVTLELVLEEKASPVEKRGEVIWCAPDIYGTGAEVGLKFLDESDGGERGEEPDEAVEAEAPLLKSGQRVVIDADGRSIPAIVEEVARCDQGDFQTVRVSLILDDGREIAPDELSDKAEEWKPHPFRDIKNWCVKYLGPAVAVLGKILAPPARLLGRGFARVWRALPEKRRARVETLFVRMDFSNRARRIATSAKSLLVSIGNLPNRR